MAPTRTRQAYCIRLLLAGALSAAAAPAAAHDMFLRSEGIQGEPLDARHRGEIDILSYSQALNGPYASATAGAGAGKTVCGPVTVTKYVDLASPDLLLSAANGRHFPTARVTFRKPSPSQLEYYRVILDDAIVTSVEQSGSGSGRVIEKMSLTGRRFRFEYTQQMPDGKTGATPKASWDCVAGKP